MTIGRIPGATGIQPTIVDAKGDIIAATSADSVTRLAVGTNNTVLMADSAEATGLKWGASAQSVMTTKGDLLTEDASSVLTRLAVGANDTVLTADSSTATGLKWATPSSGGMTLLSTTTLSGTTTTISSISGAYNNLMIFVRGVTFSANAILRIRPNSVTANMYGFYFSVASQSEIRAISSNSFYAGNAVSNYALQIFNYTNTTSNKPCSFYGNVNDTNNLTVINGSIDTTSAITSLVISTTAGTSTFTAGTVEIYGVK